MQQRLEILRRTNHRCHICGGEITSYWEADHVFAVAAGGPSSIDNFLPAHGNCNAAKSDHSGEEFQWVLKIGVWAKGQMEGSTALGQDMLKLFFDRERRRVDQQKGMKQLPDAL